MRSILERSTTEYETQLSGSDGESYLFNRGVSKETQEHFRLGFVGSPLAGDDIYRNRISIPYLTATGTVSMRYKSIEESPEKKVLSVAGDKGRPYNVAALQSVGPIFICEGEPDTWFAWQLGLNALGFPGASTWQTVYARMLRFREVYVFAQGDKAGRGFAEKIVHDVRGAQILDLPQYEDVASMYMKDKTFFEKWVTL